jgi:iron complex outermembrane receptor protein
MSKLVFGSAFVLLAAVAGIARAQSGTTLSGRVTQAEGGQPMTGALVVIDELRIETRTGDDGSYRFTAVPPGSYHVGVRAEGYTTRRAEITVGTEPATLDLVVEFDLHFAEVLSVSPNPRPQFESYQPTSVLTGQDLTRQLDTTVAGTLQSEPGIAMRAFGSAPSRPVIRGLDGDRVVVLEDGQRMGDISSQSGDHGVPINPASAEKVEVVRGPATLLYGANAIGGLVNVITDQIPSSQMRGASGSFTFDAGTNGGLAGGAGDVHVGNGTLAFHFAGSGQRQGNYSTPEGEVDNTQSRLATTSLGGAWTGEHSYVGTSYAYTDTRYGIPIVEGGEIRLTPRRHAFNVRAGGSALPGFVQSYRATLGVRRYEHQELEGDEVGTTFENDTLEGEVLLSHGRAGGLLGSVGGWLLNRQFTATGEEALSPPVDQNSVAAFAYEEAAWPHATLQFGARIDHTRYQPEGGLPDRNFTEWSASVGLLIKPKAANDDVVIAASLARAARAPALEELYFYGPHLGNFAFEIGNPNLEAERAVGFDVAVRARGPRFEGEVSFFRNDINNFIFRSPTGEEEEDLPVIVFTGSDALLTGLEAHGDLKFTPEWIAEFTYDYVWGELSESGDPLPRMPPYRVLLGLRYQKNGFQAGVGTTTAADQTRVYGEETPTDGYTTLRLYGSYAFTRSRVLNTITARLENATDELYRNHLNYLKDELPEMGRTFRLVYTLGF